MKKVKWYFTYFAILIIFVGCNESDMVNEQNQDEFILTHAYYQDENGTMQLSAEYTYNEYGNLLTSQDYIYNKSRIENTYDEKQLLLSKKTITNTRTVIVSYTYNEQGQKLSQTWDINGSGWDWQKNFTYNEVGNIVSLDYDSYVDGSIDHVQYFTYDANNNMLTHGSDYDLDGEVNHYNIVNTYDSNGNILSHTRSYNWDTGLETISTYYYYNEDDLLIKEEIDKNNDEIIDRTTYYTYNMQNEFIFVKDEYGGWIQSKEIEYDSHGNIIVENFHDFHPDYIDYNTSYTYDYDEYENLISKSCEGSCSQFDKYEEFIWKKL